MPHHSGLSLKYTAQHSGLLQTVSNTPQSHTKSVTHARLSHKCKQPPSISIQLVFVQSLSQFVIQLEVWTVRFAQSFVLASSQIAAHACRHAHVSPEIEHTPTNTQSHERAYANQFLEMRCVQQFVDDSSPEHWDSHSPTPGEEGEERGYHPASHGTTDSSPPLLSSLFSPHCKNMQQILLLLLL
jgi:hypothetical protein